MNRSFFSALTILWASLFMLPSTEAAETAKVKPQKVCQLSYLTRTDLSEFRSQGTPIRTVSSSINKVLKTSFDLVNSLDRYTLGLVSAVTLGSVLSTAHSLEDIKPNEWNRAELTGVLVFRDQPFSVTPLRGTKVSFISEEGERHSFQLTTGTQGEFTGHFHEWISYTRLRLFPALIFERKQKLQTQLKIPITIEVDSPLCHASTRLMALPLEPMTLILSPGESNP
ncbi:MAG: hypothetical protein IT288_13855 [Bdellovibrionales bacterium]|nr:hypothetical protein [Bdellovibrionales bacterium]